MRSSWMVVAVVAGVVSAEAFGDLAACGQNCINNLRQSVACVPVTDQCLCSKPEFLNGIRDCVNAACSKEDAASALSYASLFCTSATASTISPSASATTSPAPVSSVTTSPKPDTTSNAAPSPTSTTATAATASTTASPTSLSTASSSSSSSSPSSTISTTSNPTTQITSAHSTSPSTSSISSASSSTSSASSSATAAPATDANTGLSQAARIGLGVGAAAVGLVLLVFLAVLLVRRRRNSDSSGGGSSHGEKPSRAGMIKISDPLPGSGRTYAGDRHNAKYMTGSRRSRGDVNELDNFSRRYEDLLPRRDPHPMV